MSIQIIQHPIPLKDLVEMAGDHFEDMIKAVVDIKRNVMAVGGDLHADEEAKLLDLGSNQSDLWGINLHFERSEEDWIEFDSMINLRPSQNNRTRGVEDAAIREKIVTVVSSLVTF